MKEMYNAPVAEPMLFEAMEKLATGENKGIPYLDDERKQPQEGSSGFGPAPWL